MIHFVQGDMFATPYDVLVNAVNCVGVMGKGLALTFRNKYPNNYTQYAQVCKSKQLRPGQIFVTDINGQIIINAATKDHWRDPSYEEWVINTIVHIATWLTLHPSVKTIAVPKLGCGLGGLDWNRIRPVMEEAFSDCPQDIYIFE